GSTPAARNPPARYAGCAPRASLPAREPLTPLLSSPVLCRPANLPTARAIATFLAHSRPGACAARLGAMVHCGTDERAARSVAPASPPGERGEREMTDQNRNPGQQQPNTGAGSRQQEQQTGGGRFDDERQNPGTTESGQSGADQMEQQGGSDRPQGDRGGELEAEDGQDIDFQPEQQGEAPGQQGGEQPGYGGGHGGIGSQQEQQSERRDERDRSGTPGGSRGENDR